MNNYLNEDFIAYLGGKKIFDVSDVCQFFSKLEPDISHSTVDWRIYTLVQKGIMKRVGRGRYCLGKANLFQPELSPQMIEVARYIRKEFPYTNFCVWELALVNHFSHHLVNFNILFVDVERDATDAVYYKLKEKERLIVHIRKTYDTISDLAGNICIRPLVTGAPAREWEQTPVASLEKILVDLATDKEFFPFQGNVLFSIYESAFDRYTINENTLLRYASRKGKKVYIQECIKSIKRQ